MCKEPLAVPAGRYHTAAQHQGMEQTWVCTVFSLRRVKILSCKGGRVKAALGLESQLVLVVKGKFKFSACLTVGRLQLKLRSIMVCFFFFLFCAS